MGGRVVSPAFRTFILLKIYGSDVGRIFASVCPASLRGYVIAEWPDEKPPAPNFLRILYLGKILQDEDTLTSKFYPGLSSFYFQYHSLCFLRNRRSAAIFFGFNLLTLVVRFSVEGHQSSSMLCIHRVYLISPRDALKPSSFKALL